MRFRKEGGRLSKRDWRWKDKKIEEVKEFAYLPRVYTLQRNEEQEAQVRNRVRRAAAVIGQVWGIGERRFGKDWGGGGYGYLTGWCERSSDMGLDKKREDGKTRGERGEI